MAVFRMVDEEYSTTDISLIKNFLAAEGIELGQFNINALSKEKALQDILSEEERLEIINSYPEIIKRYHPYFDYRADMICLYPEFKYLNFVLDKFKEVHFHYENEHWYYIDGSSGFGFLGSDGRKFIVEIAAGEHITVPEGKWQWVIPPVNNRMKALRFFSCTRTINKPAPLLLT